MKIVGLLLCFLSFSAIAAETFELAFPNPIKISELARIVYGEILEQNYILEADLLKDDTAIVSGLRNLSKKTVDQAFRNVLEQQGFKVSKIDGVNYIRKRGLQDGFELFYYRPKYRPSAYLMDLSSSLFKEGAFTSHRTVPSAAGGASLAGSTGVPAAGEKKSGSPTSAAGQMDKDTDVLIFQGPQKEIDLLKKLLVQVDVPKGEVVVKGVVYEVSTSKNDGTAYGLALNILSGKFGLSAGLIKNLGNTVTLHNTGSIGLDVMASALSNDNRFKVLSSPNIRVKSGSTARFSSGADVPVVGAVQLDRNGNPFSSVDYKPSGVILNIVPEVRDGHIELTVNQQLSNFIPTTSGVNNSPTLLKRELTTSITAPNDDVIVLGGLTEEKVNHDRNGLSFLPAFLHSVGDSDSKTEILLLLQVQKI